jgi:hypothetical protein
VSPTPALEECEQALGGLITILESKQQLTGTEHRYSGAAFDANWSKCRVSQTRSRTRQYAVYRSNDDVTVVIEKRISAETSELYGPFKSAYRK